MLASADQQATGRIVNLIAGTEIDPFQRTHKRNRLIKANRHPSLTQGAGKQQAIV
jgi:hypothetical protein